MATNQIMVGTECVGKYNFPGSASHVSRDDVNLGAVSVFTCVGLCVIFGDVQ